jgi:hypothetical protein
MWRDGPFSKEPNGPTGFLNIARITNVSKGNSTKYNHSSSILGQVRTRSICYVFCAIFFPTTHKTFYCSDMLKHVSENFQKISLSFLYPRFNNSRLRYESYKKHFVARTSLGHDDFARSAMKE